MNSLFSVFFYFIIYSFIGWICEVIYCWIIDKKFVNRGFLNGPVCPIYGVGALLIIGCLNGFKGSIVIIFVLGAILTSAVEYLTSYILEKLFHTTLWDYSHMRYSLNGRICLLNSTLFGILSVITIEYIHGYTVSLVSSIPSYLVIVTPVVLFIIFTIDFIVSVKSFVIINEKLEIFSSLMKEFKELKELKFSPLKFDEESLNNFFEGIKNKNYSINTLEKIEVLKGRLVEIKGNVLFEKRFIQAFPTMRHKKYFEYLAGLKQLLKVKK